jgi:hypothetical protein
MDGMTRTWFLRGAASGGAAVAAGGALAFLASPAAAAPSEQDLAWVRFGITAEAVAVAFYARARTAGGWSGDERRTLERATAAQVAHRNAFRTTLVDLNEPVIDPEDVEVELPDAGFASRAAAITLGRRIESVLLHGYLGALATIADPAIRRLFAQVAASEAAQHTWLTSLQGPVLTDPFPSVHGIATAAAALAEFLP